MFTKKQAYGGNKGLIPILLLVVAAILILGGGVYYYTHRESSLVTTSGDTTADNDASSSQGAPVLEKYATLVRSDAHSVVFNFAVPISQKDVTGNNIERCILDNGAVAAATGAAPACTPTIVANNLSLSYEGGARTMTISDISNPATWANGDGPFRISCAACSVAIQFNNLHTLTGVLLPKLLITVPYQQN